MAAVQAPPNLSAPGKKPQKKTEKTANGPGGSLAQAPQNVGGVEVPPLALLNIFDAPASTGVDGNMAGKTATLSNGPDDDGTDTSTFKDFSMNPELLRALAENGLEKPSAMQRKYLTPALLGKDVITATEAGTDKTTLYVLAILHQLVPIDGEVSVLVLCHTKQLANEIKGEFDRFAKYMRGVKTAISSGEIPLKENMALLKRNPPHIMVATPGRLRDVMNRGLVNLSNLRHLVVDQGEELLVNPLLRRDAEIIAKATPPQKQHLVFAEAMSENVQAFCKNYCRGAPYAAAAPPPPPLAAPLPVVASPKDRWANSSFQNSPDPNHLPMPPMLGSLMAEFSAAAAPPPSAAAAPATTSAPSATGAAATAAASSASLAAPTPPALTAAPKLTQKPAPKANTNANGATSAPAPKTKGASPAPKGAAAAAGGGGGGGFAGPAPNQPQPTTAPAPKAKPAALPASSQAELLAMAVQRDAITSKLREAAMNSDAALLREAISEAEAAGLTFEADLGKKRLAALSENAPPPPGVPKTAAAAAAPKQSPARAPPAAAAAAAPLPAPSSSRAGRSAAAPPQPPAPAFDAMAMAAQRDAVTAKLREAAMNANTALLREAISEAEAAGLTFEADLGKKRLAALSGHAPPPPGMPQSSAAAAAPQRSPARAPGASRQPTPAAAAPAAAAARPPAPTPGIGAVDMAAQRGAITAKLRDGKMNGDAALLREGIAEAEAAGLAHEAALGKKLLVALV